MDYLSQNVAVNLKRIRTAEGMSLDSLAEQTGVSKSMLSQIENGTANPSLGVLEKIIAGLRIQINDLLETPPIEQLMVDVKELIPVKELEGGYRLWNCFPYEDNRKVEVYKMDIEPGGIYMSGGHGEKTREYITVTSGTVTVESNGKMQDVTVDQVYRFETGLPHIYRNNRFEKVSFMIFMINY